MKISAVVRADRPEFILKRVFNAPRELVYKIWTDPHYVKQWWGVEGSSIVLCELDVRPGGRFRIDMQARDGTIYVNRGVYVDVIVNQRIVSRYERDTNATPGNIPAGVHIVTFDDVDGKTLVTLTSRFEKNEDRDLMVRFGVIEGIRQSLVRFEQLVTARMQERDQ